MQSEQQRLVDRFIEYADQVRGVQLHLLREHDGSSVAETFLQQVKELQQPYAAADAAAGLPGHPASGTSSNRKGGPHGKGDTVLFRLIEGAVSAAPVGSAPGAPSLKGASQGRGGPPGTHGAENTEYGISTAATNGDEGEEEMVFAGQLESFLRLAENEIATKELTGWEQEAETSAAAVRLRSRRVIMPGALVPLALDDTLVIEHKVTLRRRASVSPRPTPTSSNTNFNGASAELIAMAADVAADIERLRDVLHLHAYQGRLRATAPEEFKVCLLVL